MVMPSIRAKNSLKEEAPIQRSVRHTALFIQILIAAVGLAIILTAFAYEWLGSGDPGFGPAQTHFLLSGMTLFLISFIPRLRPIEQQLNHHPGVLTALIVSLELGAILLGIELMARAIQGYELFSCNLWKTNALYVTDCSARYNRIYYEQNKSHFRCKDISLDLLEADKPHPVFLFKPNLRLSLDQRKMIYVPATADDRVSFTTNSWGFRGREFSVTKAPDTTRIICLGASTTEGGTEGDHTTYPFFLEQELRRLFPDRNMEVLNAGHRGHKIQDALEVLKQRVLPLKPDLVIFYEAHNNLRFGDFVKPGFHGGPFRQFLEPYVWSRWLYQHSALYAFACQKAGWNLRVPPPRLKESDPFSPKPSAEEYKNGLRQIVRECLNQKIKIVLSSFVTLSYDGLAFTHKDNPVLFNKMLYGYTEPLTPAQLRSMYDYFNQQSREVAQEFHIDYADIAPVFPHDIRYFPHDPIHLSLEGNRMLAELFAQYLARKVFRGTLTSK